MKRFSSISFWRMIFILSYFITLIILGWSIVRWIEKGVNLLRSEWIFPLGLYLAFMAVWCYSFFYFRNRDLNPFVDRLELRHFQNLYLRILGLIFFVVILVIIPWAKFKFNIGVLVRTSTLDPVLSLLLFFWLVWWLVLAGVAAMKIGLRLSWTTAFIATLILSGVAYEIYSRFSGFSTYPFAMSWSEASRYYYASLLLSGEIYGFDIPWSFLHPTRYFLQSIPFSVSGIPLWGHRLFQIFLWILLTGGTAYSMTRRVIKANSWSALLFSAWLFLFFLQIGVYYHLHVMVILICLGVSSRHFWRSLIIVIAASVWAGMSRVNWFPFPAMLAIAIYLLEEPVSSYSNLWRYLSRPFIFGVTGLAAALAGQLAYIPLSGNTDTRAFASSFTSELLWYRWWPNASYAPGVIPGILIVSVPILWALYQISKKRWLNLHVVRTLGLAGMLLLLFVGGLVVSTKIGGGADLHNMDAYAVLLGLLITYFFWKRARAESKANPWNDVSWTTVAVTLLVPVIFLVAELRPLPRYNQTQGLRDLQEFNSFVSEVDARGGDILFINERHLLTFDLVKDIPLIPEYEVLTLMEMAISNNEDYLNEFYEDLRAHRFELIVANRQNIVLKSDEPFSEENNAWNQKVAIPLLCEYDPILTLDSNNIQFFVPKENGTQCPVQ